MAKLHDAKRRVALERLVRGFSNHRRIQMLDLLNAQAQGMNLNTMAAACRIKVQVASEHVRRLEASGLVSKRKVGREVMHQVTPTGLRVLDFLESMA